jgi:ribose transport system ATP-binding protein
MSVRGISRRFYATQALDNVGFDLEEGQIMGLVGENGAGKSTLLNILCGTDCADSGQILIGDQPFCPQNYHEANKLGVFRIFQELSLIPNLPVYENIFLSHETPFMRAGVLNKRQMAQRAEELFAGLGHGWIDVRRPAVSYDFATRQAIEIVKAFALAQLLEVTTPVLLLDEPTSALSRDEIDSFFRLLDSLKRRAITIFVSHRLSEILDVCDHLLVLKDGQVVAQRTVGDATEGDLHALMVGRTRSQDFYKESAQLGPARPLVVETRELTSTGFNTIDLRIHKGEIIGIAGVMGSGKAELARCVAGIVPPTSGSLHISGSQIKRPTVAAMLRHGVAYVTPDRGDEGIFLGLPVSWNISIASLAARTGHLLDLGNEEASAGRYVTRLRVKAASVNAPARSLSGGNQQKLLLARWLALGVKVLVLDNPTRGVDAGAKEDIYEVIRELAASGVAILVVSDDLLEVIGLSDHVLVMKDGRIVEGFDSAPGGKPTESQLVSSMV